MSITAASSDAVNSPPTADIRVLLIIIWCAIAAAYLFAGWGRDDGLSTDDAMRLVEVRDFLAGQGWFDLTQYRLNPPHGVVMHWSRLIDLPLAVLIRAAQIVLPGSGAERLVVTLWPIALLFIFLAGVARLARGLADETAAGPALILAALSAPVLQHFRPGAIDHHNVQLVLLIWSLVACLPRACAAARCRCGRCFVGQLACRGHGNDARNRGACRGDCAALDRARRGRRSRRSGLRYRVRGNDVCVLHSHRASAA